MISLAADIGGTYSRFVWLNDGVALNTEPQIFTNAEFASLEAVIDHGLAQLEGDRQKVSSMALALPGPVHREPIELTNIPWRISRSELETRYGLAHLTIVNDFQAAAIGALNEPIEQSIVLNHAAYDNGPVVVTGAGTGLGMAWFARRNDTALPQGTEGGHLDFAPTNEQQIALYCALAARYGHVSYERILSGGGLVETYQILAGSDAQAKSAAEVNQLALRQDRNAVSALQLFVQVFAAYVGNLALAFNPTGGILLCGGLTVRLAEWFDPAVFAAAYHAKGRMADVVAKIPVYLIKRHDTGLNGAISIVQRHPGQTS